MTAILTDICPNGAAMRACIRASIASIQASTRCSKTCIACFENDSSSVYTKQTAALCMHRHSTSQHPGGTPFETFVPRLQREEVRCDFGLVFLVNYECLVGNMMVETCFALLYLLYSFWMSTMVSITAAGDETCRSKKQIPAESCKLWMESLRHCRAQLDCPMRPVADVFIQ